MSNKIMIVGSGNVGASIAFSLVNQRTAVNELVLTDINTDDANGEAKDLRDALAVAPSYIKISAGGYSEAKDCNIIIITAGIPQKDGETRMDLLSKNATIFKTMISSILQSGFNGIFLVITNPMDIMTYLTWKYSGFPANRVIGSGTVLDTSRLKKMLSERLNIHPKSIHADQIGEHGDTEFALWSLANVGGQHINTLFSQQDLDEIENLARGEAYSIIKEKGATYYGIGVCSTHIINCILNDEHRVLNISSYDDYTDTYNGFPTVVGKDGAIRRLDIEMNEREGIKFQKSVNALKTAIDSLKKADLL